MRFDTGCFIYWRCWGNFRPAFPFERFWGIPNDQVRPVLEELTLSWAREHTDEMATWTDEYSSRSWRESARDTDYQYGINDYLPDGEHEPPRRPTLVDVWNVADWHTPGGQRFPKPYGLPGPSTPSLIYHSDDPQECDLIARALHRRFSATTGGSEFGCWPKGGMSQEEQLAAVLQVDHFRSCAYSTWESHVDRMILEGIENILRETGKEAPPRPEETWESKRPPEREPTWPPWPADPPGSTAYDLLEGAKATPENCAFIFYRRWEGYLDSDEFPLRELNGLEDEDLWKSIAARAQKWAEEHPAEIEAWLSVMKSPTRVEHQGTILQPHGVNTWIQAGMEQRERNATVVHVLWLAGWAKAPDDLYVPGPYFLGPGRRSIVFECNAHLAEGVVATLHERYRYSGQHVLFGSVPASEVPNAVAERLGVQRRVEACRAGERADDECAMYREAVRIANELASSEPRVRRAAPVAENSALQDIQQRFPGVTLERLEILWCLSEHHGKADDQYGGADVSARMAQKRRDLGITDSRESRAVGQGLRRMGQRKPPLVSKRPGKGWEPSRGGKTLLGAARDAGLDWSAVIRLLQKTDKKKLHP